MKLNIARIREIAESSPTAKMLFAALAARERDYSITDIKRMRLNLASQGRRVTSVQIREFFKMLEDAGVGRLRMSAAGYPDVFEWFTSLKSVGEIGAGREAPVYVSQNAKETSPAAGNGKTPPDAFARELLANENIGDSEKVRLLRAYWGI